MSVDFFLGPDLVSLLRRYILVTLLRWGWFYINGGFWLFFLQPAVTPLPWGYLHGAQAAFAIVDGALSLGQIGLLLGAFRLVIIHHFPAQAVAWKLVSIHSANRKPRRRSIVITALFLCCLVVLTCGLVPWAIQNWAGHYPVPFIDYLSYHGAPALFVGAFLCLLGVAWGGGHSARAASDMSTSFRVAMVGEDHWLYQRVKRIADELGLPAPKVGITNVTNAFAMGSSPQDATVIIGQPLFKMEQDELDAIIGHELGHVISNDVQRMQFAEGFQIMLGKVISFATVILAIFAAVAASQSKTRGVNGRMGFQATMGVGNLVRGTVFIASELVVKGISRSREFHADAIGAQVTSTDAMVRALKRIHGVAVKPSDEERQYGYLMFRGAGLGNLFGTHPTLNARVKSLEARARFKDATDRALGLTGETVVPLSGEPSETKADFGYNPQEPSLSFRAGAFVARRARVLRSKRWWMWLIGIVAAIAILPAVNSYYELDRRAGEAGVMAASVASTSWTWIGETSQDLVDRWSGSSNEVAARQIVDLKLELAAATALLDTSRSETATTRALQREAELQVDRLRKQLSQRDDTIDHLNDRLVTETQEHAAAVASRSIGAEETQAAQRRLNGLLDSVTRERDELTRQVSALELQLRDRPSGIVTGNVAELRMQLSAANTEKVKLEEDLAELKTKSAAQSRTIYEWATDRATATRKIRDLEQQLSLKEIALKDSNSKAVPVISADKDARGIASLEAKLELYKKELDDQVKIYQAVEKGSGLK